jgi:hypothetical protein
MQAAGRPRQFERREIGGERRVLYVERHAEHHGLAIAQGPYDGALRIFACRIRRV